jgi:hypothetical protein
LPLRRSIAIVPRNRNGRMAAAGAIAGGPPEDFGSLLADREIVRLVTDCHRWLRRVAAAW